MSAPAPAVDPVRAEQLRLVLEGVAQSAAVGVVLSTLLVAVLWAYAPHAVLVGWDAVFLLERGAAVLFARRALRTPRDPRGDRRVERWLGVNKAFEGAVWGALAWIGLPLQVLPVSVLVMSTLGAICGNGVSLLSPLRHLYLALAFPLSLMAAAALVRLGGVAYYALAFFSPLYVVQQYGQVVLASRRIREAIGLRFENLDLVERLRAETAAAGRAREEAERANAAKSQFLAAASHDLRQPVHALGLFLEALRRTPLDDMQQRIVESAKSAGLASTDMLNTLLDFSRLEAGVITPRFTAFPLLPLLNKLETELGPLADEKQIVYRTLQRDVMVCSDPSLLELILRNLILNAVRYTGRGGLLVGWRRRGDHVLVEVYDTGIGIAADQQEAVFQEFHQLGNPERDRSKGLGLGLAIVRGLAARLDHGLSLASVEGRGTAFRLRVPVADAHSASAPASAGRTASDALAGKTVLVIDDDETVRAAMLALLASWRAQGLAAEGWREAGRTVVDPPDALICDYRLRQGETGAHAISNLRRRWRAEVPALLITGDTAPERLREAMETGIPLLHKPAAPKELFETLAALVG